MEKLLDIDRQAAQYWKDPVRVSVRPEGKSRVARFEFDDELVATRAEASKLSMTIALEKAGLRYQTVEAWANPKREAGGGHRPWLREVASEGVLEVEPAEEAPDAPDAPQGPGEGENDGDSYEHVQHPAHYGGDTPYEVIKVMRHWLSPEEFRGAMKFQIYRYTYRGGSKPGQPVERDLAKARFYLDALIDSYD